MKLEQFVKDIKTTYGETLQAIILYGEGAIQEDPSRGYELIFVLNDLSAAKLVLGSALIRRWMADNNPEPLLIDEGHIRSSLDVFAMEFDDIKARHKVLYGTLDLSRLQIKPEDLRRQCEREIKIKLLAVRERYVALYPKARLLNDLLVDSIPDFVLILRSYLRLQQLPVPENDLEILKAVAEISRLDISPLQTALQLRIEQKKIAQEELVDFFGAYLLSIEKIAGLIDRLNQKEGKES